MAVISNSSNKKKSKKYFNIPVILLSQVRKLGKRYETVNVKRGYFNNYLRPKSLAILDNYQNRQKVSLLQEELKRNPNTDIENENKAKMLDGKSIYFARQAATSGILFGSVTKVDIIQAIANQYSIQITASQIDYSRIKSTGIYKSVIEFGEYSSIVHLYVGRTLAEAEELMKGNTH